MSASPTTKRKPNTLSKTSSKIKPRAKAVCMADVQAEEPTWLWRPYLPDDSVVLISGDPDAGKSTLSLAIAAAMSKGEPLPGQLTGKPPCNVLLISAEDSLRKTIKPRLTGLGADMRRVFAIDKKDPSIPKLNFRKRSSLELLEDLIAQHKAKLIVIDPLSSFVGGDTDMFRENQVREYMDGLAEIADRQHCVIVVVRHLRKQTGGKAIYQGLGSIATTGAARSELTATETASGARVLRHIKHNLGPKGPALGYELGLVVDEDDETVSTVFRWVDVNEDEIKPTRERRTKKTDVREYILGELDKGPLPVSRLQEWARTNVISTDTIKRARKELTDAGLIDRRQTPQGWIIVDGPNATPRGASATAPLTENRHFVAQNNAPIPQEGRGAGVQTVSNGLPLPTGDTARTARVLAFMREATKDGPVDAQDLLELADGQGIQLAEIVAVARSRPDPERPGRYVYPQVA